MSLVNDQTATPAAPVEPAAATASPRRSYRIPPKLLGAVLAAAALVVMFAAGRWLHYYFTHASTDDARIKGDLIVVSPTVQGKIRLLAVDDGDRVEKGQLIAQLREEDYQAQVDVAAGVCQAVEAELNLAKADLALVSEKTQKEIERAAAKVNASKARLNEAKANLYLAGLNFHRTEKLFQSKTVSPSEMDKLRAAYDLAQAQLSMTGEELKESQANLMAAKANQGEVVMKQRRIEALDGRLEEARAALKVDQLKLEHTTITSPIAGLVAKRVAQVGEVIKPGQTVVVLVDLNQVWVEANLEETKVDRVRLGQSVDLKVDAYPQSHFRGKVANIGAAAASEFALIPSSRSAGSFTKVTQRIPIKIEVLNPDRPLRPGMMVVVGIDIRGQSETSNGQAVAGAKK